MHFQYYKPAKLFIITGLLLFGLLTYAQFTIQPNSYITIKEGSTLRIGSDLNINSNATASGYLVDQTIDGDVTITGNISVKRYMSADYWHNSSSPVSSANSSVYTGTDLVFYYDETLIINDWMFGWVMYSGALTVMRGYDIFLDANPVTVNYTATATQSINTGTYSTGVAITTFPNGETDPHRGWNLLGNPYPSPVDWQALGWNKSDINDAKYIWDGLNDNYTIWLGGSAPIGINGGTRYIPSNQGFWVQAIQNGSVQISNSTRIGETAATPDFYKSEKLEYPILDLIARANGYTDECMIRFLPETTAAFDVNFDATKLFSEGNEVPQIATQAVTVNLAINTLPVLENELMVPLSFQCKKAGYYSIEINEITNLDPFTDVYLKDVIEQKIVKLTDEISYGFYHDPTNTKARFKLFFNPSEDVINNIGPDDYFSVYSNQGQITILKNTIEPLAGEIWIYNTLGQPVYHTALSNDKICTIKPNGTAGYYFVNIQTQDHISNYKVFINN